MMFVLASVGCALSASLGQLLAVRALEGLSAGVGMVVGRAVIRDTRQGDDAQRTLSQVSMIVAVAPAVAPIVGGWILGWGHWTFIFWCLAAFSMLLLARTWLWLPATHPAQARERAGVARLLRDYLATLPTSPLPRQ